MFENPNTATEAEVISFLTEQAKVYGVASPMVIVINRNMPYNSITRKVRFVVVVPINSEKVVDGLISDCLNVTNLFIAFAGSEVNLDNGDLSMDYLYFDANIIAKIN